MNANRLHYLRSLLTSVVGVAVILQESVERYEIGCTEGTGEGQQGVAGVGVDIENGEQESAQSDADGAERNEPQLILALAELGGHHATQHHAAGHPCHEDTALQREVHVGVDCLHALGYLDEEYLYFNDDLFPVMPCCKEDFFREGKGVLGFSTHWICSGMYKKICRNSDRLAREAAGMKSSCSFMRPQHICTPMLRSHCRELYDRYQQRILNSLTRTREAINVTQYTYLNYQYYKGLMIRERISSKHCSAALMSPEKLASYILCPERKILCINDVRLSDSRYEALRTVVHESFEKLFPSKSRFER